MGAISLKVKNDHAEMDRITSALESLAEQDNWPSGLLFHVNLALEELGLNIIDYGYDGGNHEIEIDVISEEDSVTIEIVDDGRPFDPLTDTPAPDLDSPVEDRRVGGQGVHLVRTLMDEVVYRREAGKNRLRLVARRTNRD